jgi:hypothetical protein
MIIARKMRATASSSPSKRLSWSNNALAPASIISGVISISGAGAAVSSFPHETALIPDVDIVMSTI